MYTKSPVDAAERERLVEDLRETDEPGQSKSSFPKSHEFTIFYLANCIQSRLLSLMLFCVSCPEQPPPDQSPNDHPEGGCASKNSCKNRDDWRVEDKSTQHSRERRGEDHGQGSAPQLLWVGSRFRLEKSERRSQQKPGNRKGKVDGSHPRHEGDFCFAMGGKPDQGNKGNGEKIAKDKDGLVHDGKGVNVSRRWG
jgi:hypothetical protein